jgi:hypothetical protein
MRAVELFRGTGCHQQMTNRPNQALNMEPPIPEIAIQGDTWDGDATSAYFIFAVANYVGYLPNLIASS